MTDIEKVEQFLKEHPNAEWHMNQKTLDAFAKQYNLTHLVLSPKIIVNGNIEVGKIVFVDRETFQKDIMKGFSK